MFSAVDHILGYKTNLNKVKRIEIISSIFSDHNSMKLEISHRKKIRRKKNHLDTKPHTTKNQWVIIEIKEEIRKHLKTNDNENTLQNLWDAAKTFLRGTFIVTQALRKKKNLKKSPT